MTTVDSTYYSQNPPPAAALDTEDIAHPNNTALSVPRDVVSKYDVESVSETVETLIGKKIQEDTFDGEEAFYFIDLGTVLKKYRQWINLLPKVKPYYAIKCNPNPAIIKTLGSVGVNFDCASKTEIQQILGAGIAADRIIYANPTKMKSHINYAKTSGVELMTFDNSFELHKIAECYPGAKLLLRIITDDSQSVCRFSTKFGAPLPQCEGLIALAKELNLNLIGVSFHVGSGCMSSSAFSAALYSAHSVFKMAEKYGFNFTMLDLGGGWPGTDDGPIKFEEIANHIRPVLDELFSDDVQLIAEPGRYFVAESHTLAVNVFAKRQLLNTESDSRQFLYYVNDGVYQSFNCIFFDHNAPKPIVFTTPRSSELYRCTIFGPTCDSMDCIGKDLLLPELEVGDWLYFKNMGAYTVAAASPFNGFKSHPTTFYISSPF